MTIKRIKQEIAFWLNSLDNDEWDKQMIRDFSPGGRGEHLVDLVKKQIAAGQSQSLTFPLNPPDQN
jgi:hypothetical protein